MAKRGGSLASSDGAGVKENHPLTALIPIKAKPRQVVKQIEREGLREPIYLHEGKIIEGRVRYAACLRLGIAPVFKDWTQIHDRPRYPLDWMVRQHIAQHNPSRDERMELAVKLLPAYTEMRGKTREALAKALVIGNSTLQMIKALLDLNELDPVLRGEVALRDQAKRFNVSHGGTYTTYNNFSFGRGDKFDASFDPLRRYLRPWKKKKFEFPHVNPKEAARRIKIIEAVMEDLAAVKADLEPRSVAPKVIASAERRRVNGA